VPFGRPRSIVLPRLAVLVLVALLGSNASSADRAAGTGGAGPELDPPARRVLSERGFVVVEGRGYDIREAYSALADRDVPVFVTTDAVLLSTRSFLDGVLASIENGYLHGRLEELSRELVRLSEDQYLRATDPAVKDAALRNIAFFAVPLSLLDPDYFPSEFALSLVERELAMIEEGQVVALSPIMGAAPLDGVLGPGEDYKEYVPRGRYSTDDRAARFYRAMTWYSRMAFALPEGRVEDYGPTLQALLVVQALESEAGEWFELWERVYEPLTFYVGHSGDPTVRDYVEAATEIFGEGFGVDDLADAELVTAFVSRVGETAPSHVETHEVRGLRLLSRRFFPDTRFLYRLSSSADRSLPSTVDLMALLASPAARQVLEGEDVFAGDAYRLGFEEIELALDRRTYDEWMEDLNWSWLYALSALLGGPPEGAPAFMRSPAWEAKVLSTSTASWATLRRSFCDDSRAPSPAGIETSPDAVPPFVEPYPQLYARLREIVEHLRDKLWEHYLLDDVLAQRLEAHSRLLTSLEESALGLLSGGPAREPRGVLSRYVARLRSPGAEPSAPSGGASSRGRSRLAFSVPAFRNVSSGELLETALGDPDFIYVVVDVGGEPVAYGGAVQAFYEFGRSAGPPLEDEEWWSRLDRGVGARPVWVRRFLVD
jgi:hypothetical protein